MALTTDKTIYLNGTSKDGDNILANFNASLTQNGNITINETIQDSSNELVDTDFDDFRKLAKSEFNTLNGISSEKSGEVTDE